MSINLSWLNTEIVYADICKNKKGRYTREEIEARAKEIRALIWNNRNDIWFDDDVPSDRVKMLNPSIAATLLGFNCEEVSSLGGHVAGSINNKSRKIQISLEYPPEIRNFTAAHELGHAVLHREMGLHRDRPLNGTRLLRNETEDEADQFAAAFLMPEELIRIRFKQVFLTEKFILNEDTAFALGGYDYGLFIKRFKTLRQLSRILASTEQYNNRHFVSLANQLNVSDEAMAIRLEELGLLTI